MKRSSLAACLALAVQLAACKGAAAQPGATGAQGAAGVTGTAGAAGAKGATGPVGATGAAGPQGNDGPVGYIGPQGPTGSTGPGGATGPAGPTGPMGAAGSTGVPGSTGPAGPSGVAYVRTVLVSPLPAGTTLQNGAALVAALAGITTASATNPWLVKIEPGVYDLGTTPFAMKPYVDLNGSGEDMTTLTSEVDDGNPAFTGAASSELRLLTVEDNAVRTPAGVIALQANDPSFRATQATIAAANGAGFSGSGTLRACTIKGSQAVLFQGNSSLTIVGSSIEGTTDSIVAASPGAFSVVDSKVDGTVAGSVSCAYDYNGSFAPLNSSCK